MKLSEQKRVKISEQILSFLFHNFPNSYFTAEIARELARDEEFVKSMLSELKNKELVIQIKKNNEGIFYSRRIKWRLSNTAFNAYKQI